MLFKEWPLLERFGEARAAGFDAVEILFPYDDPVPALHDALTRNGLELSLINTPPPNWTGGARGFAAVPDSEARFRHDFKRTLRFSNILKPKHIHIMAGVAEGRAAHQTFIKNLQWAAAEAPMQSLTIEPINITDMPGYFLCDFDQAAEILDAVDASNLNLQFDAYHAHMITGNTMKTWEKHGGRAVHVQVASAEGRHEPDAVGAIDYPAFFARLDADGYDGVVSGEYTPRNGTPEGLGWIREML